MLVNAVLSGGGARGIAHLGIIKALREMGFDINAISGTSTGALAGAFIAVGYEPDDALRIIKKHPFLRLVRGAFNKGFFSMKAIEKTFLQYFPANSFEDLKCKLYISAANISTGKTEYFSEGPLVAALIASTSVPLLFSPATTINCQLVDGGILNNLPVEPFLDSPIPIIGIHVNPVAETGLLTSALKIAERTFHLVVYSNVIDRLKKCDFLIEPPGLAAFPVYAYSKADEIFKTGYDHTVAIKDDLMEFMKGRQQRAT